ncbi:MAG: hypothetical protein ACOYOT_13085 [Bacteroidales bacterium]
MKQFFLVIILIILSTIKGYSQDAESKWALELYTGKNEYRGDRNNDFFSGGVKYSGFSGIAINKDFVEVGLARYINPNFDLSFKLSSGEYGTFRDIFNQFSGRKNDFTLALKYKINNGYLLSENSLISPFFSVGLGAATYNGYESSVPMSYLFVFGVGFNLRLSSALSIQYHLGYDVNSDDKADRKTIQDLPPKSNNDFIDGKGDNFLKHTFGIVINFGNFGKSNGNNSSYSGTTSTGSIFNINRNKGRLFNKK